MELKSKYLEKLEAGQDPTIRFNGTSRKLSWIAKNPVEAIHKLQLEHLFDGTSNQFKSIIKAMDGKTGVANRVADYAVRDLRLPAGTLYEGVTVDGLIGKASTNVVAARNSNNKETKDK